MAETLAGLDLDAGNRTKCQKYDVSVADIEALFSSPLLIIPDGAHSKTGTRIRALGKTGAGRMVYLVSMVRLKGGQRLVRPIAHATCMAKRLLPMKKKIPSFKTDAAAGRFVSRADLTRFDLSGFKPVRFEFEKKTAQLNMRLPKALLDAVKIRAQERGIPYTRFLRELIERGIASPLR
jgi:predicted DNA binding CopG/RHH family protein/uncharacterized DUF497 family protein